MFCSCKISTDSASRGPSAIAEPLVSVRSALFVVAATANWVVRCKATQLAVAASITNHSALSLDKVKSAGMWSDEVR